MYSSFPNIIFTYHGIHDRDVTEPINSWLFRNSISEQDFIQHLNLLKKSLKRKSAEYNQNQFVIKNFLLNIFNILVTFDDGYRNNLRAAEISCDILGVAPFTVFLTTNLIDSVNSSIWTVNIALLILRAEFLNNKIDFNGEKFFLTNYQTKVDCFNFVRNQLKRMRTIERIKNYDLIVEQALSGELDRLLDEYPEFQMLRLDEVKKMQSMGVEFESHGHNHELMHSEQDLEIIESEITESKNYIEKNLNQKCKFFAFPNGDYCDSAIASLKRNGFKGAYTTKVGVTKHLEGNFEIPRLTPNDKLYKFKKQLRGKIA